MFVDIVFALLIAIIALLGYVLFVYVFTQIHNSMVWFHHFIPHRIKNLDITQSEYYGKRKKQVIKSQTGMWPTIDDTVLMGVAEQMKRITRRMSDRNKASCILHFVQQNVAYRSDTSTHGEREYWELPINTLVSKRGDCEDSAFLCACLMHLCGLDCIVVSMYGHMTVACSAKPLFVTPFTKMYEFDSKIYYRAETTSPVNPYSMAFSTDIEPIKLYAIERPDKKFKSGIA